MTNEREELQEMIAAYALDAVDDLERARIERVLAEDPEGRQELARYEDAIAALVTDDIAIEPPADVWTGIAARIAATPRPVVTRRSSRARWLAVAAAVLVVVAGGVLAAVNLGGPSRASQMAAAQRDPQAGTGALVGSVGQAPVALRADGRGYLDIHSLAPLPAGKVYQLWSLDAEKPVSLGVVRPRSGIATFKAAPDSHTLALTVEPEPGVDQPTSAPVATVTLA